MVLHLDARVGVIELGFPRFGQVDVEIGEVEVCDVHALSRLVVSPKVHNRFKEFVEDVVPVTMTRSRQ